MKIVADKMRGQIEFTEARRLKKGRRDRKRFLDTTEVIMSPCRRRELMKFLMVYIKQMSIGLKKTLYLKHMPQAGTMLSLKIQNLNFIALPFCWNVSVFEVVYKE